MATARHILTATDLKALRACRALHIHGNVGLDGETREAIVRILVETPAQHYGVRSTTETTFTTYARCDYYGVTGARERFAGGKVTGYVSHYPEQVTPVGTILALLKVGDEIGISWGVGGHTSPALNGREVTGDTLNLHVRRLAPRTGKTTDMVFVLDTCISTDPTTRLILAR